MKTTMCNVCGKRFNMWDEYAKLSMYTTLGYGSEHDGDDLCLDICCKCMDDFIDRCVISPIVERSNTSMITEQ